MQGRKKFTPQLFYELSLDRLVPKDNFYRKISLELDFQFLYSSTKKYYGTEGHQSIDPVVFFKILLVGYLNNINSDRALLRFCSRMVRGKRQAVDSAFIKANASMDSLVEKEVLDDASAFVNELEENSEYKVTTTRKKLVNQHYSWKEEAYKGMPGNTKSERKDEDGNTIRPKYLSNHTHYSPTDPDAKISVKPGKARQLNYSGQVSVDDAHHVITGACGSTSGSKDSAIFNEIMDQTLANFKENNLQPDEILADAGYSSGESLSYCQKHRINAFYTEFWTVQISS